MEYGANARKSSIIAGIAAGATESIVIAPFELVKVKLQAVGSSQLYSNTFDAVVKVINNGGIRSIYRGLESTLWRNVFWNGGYFGVIQQVKSMLPKSTNEKEELLYSFISGSIAGIFGTTINTPFDVVKSRIQYDGKGRWTIPTLIKILHEEGLIAAYKGYAPKVLRLGPGGGIMLVVFEGVTKLLSTYT
jgi:solute carrier family 25 2-oxodicarboxylate transporter 21